MRLSSRLCLTASQLWCRDAFNRKTTEQKLLSFHAMLSPAVHPASFSCPGGNHGHQWLCSPHFFSVATKHLSWCCGGSPGGPIHKRALHASGRELETSHRSLPIVHHSYCGASERLEVDQQWPSWCPWNLSLELLECPQRWATSDPRARGEPQPAVIPTPTREANMLQLHSSYHR